MSLIDKDHGYHGPLIREGMKSNPIEEFAEWMSHIGSRGTQTLMSLSTVSKEGKPSCRTVDYGGLYNHESIVFTTDATSKKGTEFKNNPNVALTFCFQELNLQIRIEGVVKELPDELLEKSYYSLPRDNQLTLLIGNQSQSFTGDRDGLVKLRDEVAKKYQDTDKLPTPPNWKAFGVVPQYFEFFKSYNDWLCDRISYNKQPDGTWDQQRLLP